MTIATEATPHPGLDPAYWPAEWEQFYPNGKPHKPTACGECRGWGWLFLRWPVGMTWEWWECHDIPEASKGEERNARLRVRREKVEPCWACAAWRTKRSYEERKQPGDKKGGKA